MTDARNGPPSVTDIARRLQRVEDKLDERIATTDMLRSTEKLFEARELTNAAATQAHEARITRLELSNSRLTLALVTAFLALLIQVIVQVANVTGRAG